MLVEKEVIRPGQYFYRDEQSGSPRKLVVTPELTKHWHDQGNAMLASGLTIPVPCEHDFDAHPMTPADRLKNNAGWVKGYTLKGDKLFSSVDVTDESITPAKLAGSIRWTSPWINSFTDGNGKEWKNVISHLALTTRPRVVNQEPFTGVAAALSMATEAKVDECGDKGLCLSRAGLILGDAPAYPMAFSLWAGGVAMNTEHDKIGRFTGSGVSKGRKKKDHKKEAASMSSRAEANSSIAGSGHDDLNESTEEARGHAKDAAKAASEGNHQQAAYHHMKASERHYALATHPKHEGTYFSRVHMAAHEAHNKAADAHIARKQKEIDAAMGILPPQKGKPPKPGSQPESQGGKPDANPTPEEEIDIEGDGEDDDIGGDSDNEMDDADMLNDANGDIAMEELLCDLLQALGVPMPDESNEQEFKRHLYEAVMSKIKELTSQGLKKDQDANDPTKNPDQNKPPNQNPNTSHPNKAQNPLIQQEQQPMYMSLEDINKLPDPMKGVALAMYNENVKLRTEMESDKKVVNSLRDAKLKDAASTRLTRVSLLSRLSPRVKADLDAMLAIPAMALSMGEGGIVVDPMAQTLAILEKGLADIPRLLTTDQSALSVQPHPQDADALTTERADEIADGLARHMGCPPVSKAG